MAFLDTASARLYVEDKTEILFLPPEVRCLTILGQLYGLASQRCQTAADQLSQAHGGAAGLRLTPTTAAGSIVSLLTTATALEQLPTADALRAAAIWDDATAAQLADVRLQLRSEERRVGQECVRKGRSRWSPTHEKKKKR